MPPRVDARGRRTSFHCAETWSQYKHHNTAKFLIGITSQGVFSFISQGWGGRVSDKYLTEDSVQVFNIHWL